MGGQIVNHLMFFWVARDGLLYVMVMKCWDDFSLFIECLKLCWMLVVTSVIASKVLCIYKFTPLGFGCLLKSCTLVYCNLA